MVGKYRHSTYERKENTQSQSHHNIPINLSSLICQHISRLTSGITGPRRAIAGNHVNHRSRLRCMPLLGGIIHPPRLSPHDPAPSIRATAFVSVAMFRAVPLPSNARSTAAQSGLFATPFAHHTYATRLPTASTSGTHLFLTSCFSRPRSDWCQRSPKFPRFYHLIFPTSARSFL